MKPHFLRQSILTKTLMIISVLIIFIFSSCNKEEIKIDDNNETAMNDNYYVKYVISSSYPRIFSNWSVTTPQGNYTKNNYQTRHWEETYGPVKKGFNCKVQVENGEPTVAIYVAKNQEPFALKTTRTGQSASYIIDF
ncbi:hypothetical protein [Limibacterium fermenti]|uniref:hypothetical protein n=1 Tax=Limibacterium fermenti TaxID=3229863 RepID=UPI003A7531D6